MVTIRNARPSDAPAIAAVHVDTWRDAYAGLLPDRVLLGMSREREARRWRHTLARGGDTVLVAERGAVVGFGSCGPARHQGLGYAGEIFTLYVHSDHQAGGVGGRLLDALFAALIERGMRSALVWVVAGNPARFFYEAAGGGLTAWRDERLWGATVRQHAYGWADLGIARRRAAAHTQHLRS